MPAGNLVLNTGPRSPV